MQEHQQDAGQADRRETASNQNEDLAVPFERSTGKIKVTAQLVEILGKETVFKKNMYLEDKKFLKKYFDVMVINFQL